VKANGYAKNIQELVYNNEHKRLEPSSGTNQAHHVAFYLISGMTIGVKFSVEGSRNADKGNPPDLQLAKIGARLGDDIKNNRIIPGQIGVTVYQQLKSGNFKP
jgi:hypothetical protein